MRLLDLFAIYYKLISALNAMGIYMHIYLQMSNVCFEIRDSEKKVYALW